MIENDELPTWTDSYNEGQLMNRLIQTARIADEIGDEEARDNIIETIKDRLENWLTANSNEVAFIFYYNNTWSTLIGTQQDMDRIITSTITIFIGAISSMPLHLLSNITPDGQKNGAMVNHLFGMQHHLIGMITFSFFEKF